MEYYSGYYWRQEDKDTSLVLKHLVYRDSGIPVFFGCMQGKKEKQSECISSLVEWFYQRGLKLCKQGQFDSWKVEEALYKKLNEFQGETLSVLLCVGDNFWLWNQGLQKICFVNTRFAGTHLRFVAEPGMESVLSGKVQKGVGILAMTEDFFQKITEAQLEQCLNIKELDSESRIQRRITELGNRACEMGGQHVGAMLLVTC